MHWKKQHTLDTNFKTWLAHIIILTCVNTERQPIMKASHIYSKSANAVSVQPASYECCYYWSVTNVLSNSAISSDHVKHLVSFSYCKPFTVWSFRTTVNMISTDIAHFIVPLQQLSSSLTISNFTHQIISKQFSCYRVTTKTVYAVKCSQTHLSGQHWGLENEYTLRHSTHLSMFYTLHCV